MSEHEELKDGHDHVDFRNAVRAEAIQLIQETALRERQNPAIRVDFGETFGEYRADDVKKLIAEKTALENALTKLSPIPMILTCPMCCARHIDAGEFATKPHYTHSCQKCGFTWRPAVIPTVGVQFLPGFKDEEDHHD